MKILKRLMPRSFFKRALIILLAPMVLAQLVAAYIFFERHLENLSARLAYGVAGDIGLVMAVIERFDSMPERRDEAIAVIQRYTDLRVRIEPQQPLPDHNDTSGVINRALDHNLSLRFNRGNYIIIDREPERLREVRIVNGEDLVHIEIPQRRLHSPTAEVFLFWMVGSAAFFLGIAVLFLRNQIRPITRLARAAEEFGKGQEVIGFKPEGASELRQAAEAFMLMRDRIKRQISQRTEMLAGVSHDLRTPLTRMKLQLALMKEQHGFDELRMDIDEMERMVEGYLAFARGEAGEASSRISLDDLLQQIVADAKRTDDSREISYAGIACELTARPQALRRCFTNLVSNALRYAHKVAISAELTERAIFIHIDDDGPGIPEDKREDVLRPFVRLDDSRNPDTGGVGLGLTIARDIARSHGGDLSLRNSPMGGLRATVRLPV